MGIFAFIIVGLFISLWVISLKDAYSLQLRIEKGKKALSFREELSQFLDKKFYQTVLFLPVLAVRLIQLPYESNF